MGYIENFVLELTVIQAVGGLKKMSDKQKMVLIFSLKNVLAQF